MSSTWVDGLPPVGCECEYYDGVGWEFCIFIGRVNDEDFVLPLDGEIDRMKAIDPSRRFRPIKTQEDTEREEAINAMGCVVALGLTAQAKQCFGELYDAGYHNGPKVKKLSDEEIASWSRGLFHRDYRVPFISGAKRVRDYMLSEEK